MEYILLEEGPRLQSTTVPTDIDLDPKLVKQLGGDVRIARLIDIAWSAYTWLPANIVSINSAGVTSMREQIVKAIEAFGIQCVPIPWEKFPKRFHKNKPALHLLMMEADADAYIADLIAANQETPVKTPKRVRKS